MPRVPSLMLRKFKTKPNLMLKLPRPKRKLNLRLLPRKLQMKNLPKKVPIRKMSIKSKKLKKLIKTKLMLSISSLLNSVVLLMLIILIQHLKSKKNSKVEKISLNSNFKLQKLTLTQLLCTRTNSLSHKSPRMSMPSNN